MLQCLNQLGYAVEWRVINAAEYGMPQRRRRIFFLGYHQSTNLYRKLQKSTAKSWFNTDSTISKAFPIQTITKTKEFELESDLIKISDTFNLSGKTSPFENTGLMINGKVQTVKISPKFDGKNTVLADVLQNDAVPQEFYIKDAPLKTPKIITLADGSEQTIETEQQMWQYLKGSKKEKRSTKDGFEYHYTEGAMVFPDALDNASRTIITGEGGKSPSRFKHVVQTKQGLRRLTPLELERLNMFPDNHTKLNGITDTKRAFFMGNALVVGIVEKLGEQLYRQIYNEQTV